MPLDCPSLTLSEAVDLYCVFKNTDKRKQYKNLLILAQEVWKEVFQQTIFSTQSVYVEMKKGVPYNYVEIPSNSLRVFGLSVEDKCRNLKPLYYNSKLNVLVKPTKKTCGCVNDCGCDGMCESIGSLVATTKEVIIDGTTYTETTWIKVCNGDVMEYRTIPTKRYEFNRGSYDPSYDFSYEIGTSSESVVMYTLTRKLCNLDTLPCGCPDQTKENVDKFSKFCGCYCNPLNPIRRKCEKNWGECDWYAGSFKISECGSKLYIENIENFDQNQWLILTYQANGINPDDQTQIPDYAKMCLFTGIDYYKNLFNDRLNPNIKQLNYYKYIDEQNKIIVYNNRFAIEDLQALNEMATW